MKKITKIILKTISSVDIDLEKDYKKQRKMNEIIHFNYLKFLQKTVDAFVEVDNHKIPIRIFFPKGEEKNKLIVFFHGGGWTTGTIDSYNKSCYMIAMETGQIVISIDYRLAPENPFPDGLHDCYEVTKKLFLENDIFDVPSSNITLMGDSAGGNLAAAVSLMARDQREFYVKKQILLYPSTHNDHSENSPFRSHKTEGKDYLLTCKNMEDYTKLYQRSPEDLNNPYFAPLESTDLSNQPDTLIITAEHDPLRDEGEMYGEKLKKFGNKVEVHRILDTIHGFFNFPIWQKANKETYSYINAFLNGDDNTHETREK